jgi:hypothetical protein
MPKVKKRSSQNKINPPEQDATYLLKLVLYLIIGSLWLRIDRGSTEIPIPVGFVLGLLFARKDHFQIDRKIEYAILLMAMFLGFWILPGVQITLH